MAEEFFDCEIRVRYAETDQMGVSYYGNYFTWFEVARTEHFRDKGVIYTELEEQGYFLTVVNVDCTYLAPTRYDDLIVIRTVIDFIGKTSLKFTYEVFLKEGMRKVAEGSSSHVFVNSEMKPKRIPEEVCQILSH